MSRYDKYEPKGGGFRAPLAANMTAAQVDVTLGVGLDVNGRVVIGGGGNTGFVGVVSIPRQLNAGDIVDVMTHGEIVEAALAAGTTYYLAADGTLATAAPAAGVNAVRVGRTVEADRLIVRVEGVQG